MRGKVKTVQVIQLDRRITPAYAGKRPEPLQTSFFVKDHPRLCGEKLIPIEFGGIETGSPPPMRGKAHGCHLFPPLFRITPAYAGKSYV